MDPADDNDDDRWRLSHLPKTVRDKLTICVKEELTATDGRAIEWAYPRPPTDILTRQIGVSKSPRFNLQPNGWKSMKIHVLIEHIREHIGWLYSDATNNRTTFAKAPTK